MQGSRVYNVMYNMIVCIVWAVVSGLQPVLLLESQSAVFRRAIFIASFACVYWQWEELWLTAAALGWGLMTSASRALMGRHYVGDVLAGIGLGVFITSLVTQVRHRLLSALPPYIRFEEAGSCAASIHDLKDHSCVSTQLIVSAWVSDGLNEEIEEN